MAGNRERVSDDFFFLILGNDGDDLSPLTNKKAKEQHDGVSTPTRRYLDGERQPLLASSAPISTATPPPDGGIEAWLVVLAGFFIFVNSW
jgi:hypothetical protein